MCKKWLDYLMTGLLQIYPGTFNWKEIENHLRFDRIMAISSWPHFLAHSVYRYSVKRWAYSWVLQNFTILYCRHNLYTLLGVDVF